MFSLLNEESILLITLLMPKFIPDPSDSVARSSLSKLSESATKASKLSVSAS